MKTKVLTFLFLLIACLPSYAQQRIIGGTAVDITQRPYQAAVFVNGRFNGGGVIISDQWLLTAAHVVRDYSPLSVTISTGYTNLNNDSRHSTVSQIILHHTGDIALIKLSAPLSFSSARKPVKISKTYNYSRGTAAVVSGWGQRSVGGEPSLTQLYRANITVKSCTPTIIETSASNNTAYRGDSGGPLTIASSGEDLLIGLVSSGSYSNPTNNSTNYVNVGYYYNWILTSCPNVNFTVSGPDLLENTATYMLSYLPPNCTLDLSPNISLVSQSGKNVTVRKITKGRGYITVKSNNVIVGQKFFWVGEPVISGVTNSSYMLTLETFGVNASITQTEWRIGGNIFTGYGEFISTPYSSGTYDVTVRARNVCGWSTTFSTRVTFGNSYYNISVDNASRQVTVLPSSDNEEVSALSSKSINNGTIGYTVINMLTGSLATSGTLPAMGGMVNLNNLSKDIYLLKLDMGNGNIQTFKIQLK